MIGEHDPWRECPDCGGPIGKHGCDCQAGQPESCKHPQHWRQSTPNLVGDGDCLLCGASASTIQCERASQMKSTR